MGVFRVLCVMLVVAFTTISSSAVAAPAPDLPQAAAPVEVPAPVPTVVAPAAPPDPAPAAPAPAPAPAPGPTPEPRLVAGTPCSAAASACADLSSNQAWLIRDGKVAYGPTKIVHGRKGYRTRAGTFRVQFKNRDHVSSIYDVAMPNAVFFNGNIAFHQGQLSGGSHGCVRMSKAASKVFFASLGRGDVVQVVR